MVVDEKLLLDIFEIYNPSMMEDLMIKFIEKYLIENDIPYEKDGMGNVFNLDDSQEPILSAHMDSVLSMEDEFLLPNIDIWDGELRGFGAIGGDDKCGIYIILKLLKEKTFNFLFTVQEEIGAKGIQYFFNENDISHIPYGVVLDRNGSGDILCVNNNYGVASFEKMLLNIGRRYGYSVATGIFSDADYLSEHIFCCNLSVGYYSPHTDQDWVYLADLDNAVDYVKAITEQIKIKFQKPIKKVVEIETYNPHDKMNKRFKYGIKS